VHDAFRDALVVEVEDLLPKVEVLEGSEPPACTASATPVDRNRT